jgi:5-methylcytosine-specific restriction protein A
MSLLRHLAEVAQGKTPLGKRRSSEWPKARREHLRKQPFCSVCGGSVRLEVHHIRPFHLQPELELEPSNLITLCESGRRGVHCHLLFGHRGSFRLINPQVREDARRWRVKLGR